MKTKLITAILLLSATLATASPNATSPTNIDSLIRTQIEAKYSGAVIVDVENENGKIEVDIVHKQTEKDVIFNNFGVWQSTKYDILKTELPKKITEAIKKSKYSSYSIDDVEVIETPSRSIYEIELEKWFSDDITIYITFDGVII